MHTVKLRKVGGSIMLPVPPAFLDQLNLSAGSTVGLVIEQGCLVISPRPRPRYTLSQLLSEYDFSEPRSAEEQEWIDAPPIGREIL